MIFFPSLSREVLTVSPLSSIPGRVIPKTLKMVLDTSLLNTQQYKVRIEGKVEQSRERIAPSPIPSSYWKGSLLVALDYGCQLYLYIYIYIYIYKFFIYIHIYNYIYIYIIIYHNYVYIYIYIYTSLTNSSLQEMAGVGLVKTVH